MTNHAIERTSPKGEKFVGTCMKCGRTGLTVADGLEECDNPAGVSDDDALVMAIDGPQQGCDHRHWDFKKHGRRCTCGALMADMGD